MTEDVLSRRSALTAGGLVLSAPVVASAIPRDVSLRRVIGTSTPGGRRQMPFDGRLSMVASTGHAMPAFGIRGVVETSFAGGDTLLCHRSWTGAFTDLTGAPLPERVQNPVTGQWLTVPQIAAETSFEVNLTLQIRNRGPFVIFDFREPGPAVFAPTLVQSYTALAAQLSDTSRTTVAAHGAWRATGPWPTWLAMADAPGHVALDGRIGIIDESQES